MNDGAQCYDEATKFSLDFFKSINVTAGDFDGKSANKPKMSEGTNYPSLSSVLHNTSLMNKKRPLSVLCYYNKVAE